VEQVTSNVQGRLHDWWLQMNLMNCNKLQQR
jgi:hypothetical protein